MKVVTRKQWGARAPRDVAPNDVGPRSVLYIHYTASDGDHINAKGERKAEMRGLQRFHQDTRGWSDIAYSYVLFQARGIFKWVGIFEGRTFDRVPASQEDENTGNCSICVVADGNDKISWRTKRKLKAFVRRCPARNVLPHSASPSHPGATECPGDQLRALCGELDRVAKQPKRTFLR